MPLRWVTGSAEAHSLGRSDGAHRPGDRLSQPEICGTIGARDLWEAFPAPVRSAKPVLLISGDLDLRTPPSNADEVRAAGLTRASHLVLARAGHDDDLLVASPELQKAIVRFLAGDSIPDQRIELPAIPFAQPK